PDRYTLLYRRVRRTLLNGLSSKPLPYNPQKDFTGVAMLSTRPVALRTSRATGTKPRTQRTVEGRAEPGQRNLAPAGLGNSTHLAVELISDELGISMLHIPYRGETDGIIATMSGQTEVMAPVYGTALPNIKTKKLNALAVLSPQRMPELPDVPTLSELGVKGFDTMGWSAVVARAGTPPEVVEKLNKATEAFHDSPDVQAKFATLG